jgi:hypothetical protein
MTVINAGSARRLNDLEEEDRERSGSFVVRAMVGCSRANWWSVAKC